RTADDEYVARAGTFSLIGRLFWSASDASLHVFEVAVAVWAAITAPYRGQAGGTTAYKHVALSFARSFLGSASIEQIQYILPPESAQSAYESLMRRQKRTPSTVTLPNGTIAFWLGNPKADKVVIYFPGGGYCIPALPGHFDLVDALANDLEKHGQDTGILFLTYDLAPFSRWPRQLEQAVSLLRYAIEVLGKCPSDIILQGDSSGAHLVLAVLSLLAHPHQHKSIATLTLNENLRGALLLSPWIDFQLNHESFHTNADRDAISAKSLGLWAQALLGDSQGDEYSHLAEAPAGWWRVLPVENIFIGVGG
ncbi:esterase, partial [Penicillium tannophilum]